MKIRHGTALVVCALLAGCMSAPKGAHSSSASAAPQADQAPPQQTDSPTSVDRVIAASAMEDAGITMSTPKDAQPAVPVVFQLVCYQLKVPIGTVSRNEEFWKRIDEQCLDPARYDLVRRNGIRVGEAAVSEFENIRNLLDQSPGSGRTMGTLAPDAKNIEIVMKKDIPFETVNYYDDNNLLCGRSFDASDNILNLSYQRTPRKIGDMRLSLTPMVRSLRKHMEFTAMNQSEEIEYTAPEKFYLSLIVDLPMDKFLVVAPSDSANLPTLLGHQFFVKDDPSEQMEQVLIFVAQPYRLDQQTQAHN